jgi:beta-barrel assembly-enhancing protease
MQDTCVYFDGQTAQANPCTLLIDADCLYIYLTEQNNKQLIINKASINYHLKSSTQLTIKIGEYPQQVLEYKGEDATQLSQQLAENGRVKKDEGYFLNINAGTAIIAVLIFVGLCLVGFFVVLPFTAEKAATLIPRDAELALGNKIAESFISNELVNDSATYYANAFVKELRTNCNYKLNVTVLNSDEINAFAVPGGQLFVYSGIVNKTKSHEELVALLGHEISHVQYQHSLKSICRSASSGLFIGALVGDVSGISTVILQQANEFKQLNYSRQLETEADEMGLQLMLRNNVSPKGMIDLLTMLNTESEEMPKLMKYFSSHPETIDRINNIKSKPQAQQRFASNAKLKLVYTQLKNACQQ